MHETLDDDAYQMAVLIENESDHEMTFYLEPWGEWYPFPAGTSIRAVAYGPPGGELHLLHGYERIEVWGWAGSTVDLWQDGVALGPGASGRPPIPTARDD